MTLMKRDEIIRKLRDREAELRAQGVAHAALFGSVARGDDRPESDIDIMVELAPEARIGLFQYVGIGCWKRSWRMKQLTGRIKAQG
jgi:predicted nucleotidyltransferase